MQFLVQPNPVTEDQTPRIIFKFVDFTGGVTLYRKEPPRIRPRRIKSPPQDFLPLRPYLATP